MNFRFGRKKETGIEDTQQISVPVAPRPMVGPNYSEQMDRFRIDNLNQARIILGSERSRQDVQMIGNAILANMEEICERHDWELEDALVDSAGASDMLRGR